jgi:hypothetical protein
MLKKTYSQISETITVKIKNPSLEGIKDNRCIETIIFSFFYSTPY